MLSRKDKVHSLRLKTAIFSVELPNMDSLKPLSRKSKDNSGISSRRIREIVDALCDLSLLSICFELFQGRDEAQPNFLVA